MSLTEKNKVTIQMITVITIIWEKLNSSSSMAGLVELPLLRLNLMKKTTVGPSMSTKNPRRICTLEQFHQRHPTDSTWIKTMNEILGSTKRMTIMMS